MTESIEIKVALEYTDKNDECQEVEVWVSGSAYESVMEDEAKGKFEELVTTGEEYEEIRVVSWSDIEGGLNIADLEDAATYVEAQESTDDHLLFAAACEMSSDVNDIKGYIEGVQGEGATEAAAAQDYCEKNNLLDDVPEMFRHNIDFAGVAQDMSGGAHTFIESGNRTFIFDAC